MSARLAAGAALVAATLGSGEAQAQAPYMQSTPYGAPTNAPYGSPYGAPAYASAAPPVAHDEDSGRGLELVYARAGLRGAMVASQALGKGELRLKDPTGFGGALDLGVGVRFLVLSVGPRARALVLSNGTLFQVGAEVALRIPIGRLDPFVGIEDGYTFGSRSKDAFTVTCAAGTPTDPCAVSGPSRSVNGLDLGLTGGLDYYVSPMVSFGGQASVLFLFLSREGLPWALANETAATSSGSGTGLGLLLGGNAALHF